MLPVRAQNNRLFARRLRVVSPASVYYGDEFEIFEDGVSLGQTVVGVLDFQTLLQHAYLVEVAFRAGKTPDNKFDMKHVFFMIINGCDLHKMGEPSEDKWNLVEPCKFVNLTAIIQKKDRKPYPKIIPATEVVIQW